MMDLSKELWARAAHTMGVTQLALCEIVRDGQTVGLACGMRDGELVALDTNGADWSDVLTDDERRMIEGTLK